MPFKSTAQRAWMYSQKPAMATEWQAHTPKNAKLPEHVGDKPKPKAKESKPKKK